jgi:hypothetical protein
VGSQCHSALQLSLVIALHYPLITKSRRVQQEILLEIGNALTFAQTPKTDGGQDITFTFTASIYELSFIITDIDNGLTGDWRSQ